jgi:hypothetical protein
LEEEAMITATNIKKYKALKSHGPLLRYPLDGQEAELVERYLTQWLSSSLERGSRVTVFLEPRLVSGYPDVVAVYWTPTIASRWPRARSDLTPIDIRIIHQAYLSKRYDESMLGALFGRATVVESTDRLEAARIIVRGKRSLRLQPLREIFAVKRLVAIEAKIAAVQRGLDQAFHNTWFASESYLLVPALPRKTEFLSAARNLGIGLLIEEIAFDEAPVRARKDRLPKSYPSWLFNEWAWRSTL